MQQSPENQALKPFSPDPDPSKTLYDLSKYPPNLEEGEQHVKCIRVGKRKDLLEMNDRELEEYLREVCPCCGSYPPSEEIPTLASAEELTNLGLAERLVSVKTGIWTIVYAICGLLSLYMVIRNILGNQCLTEEDTKNPNKVLGNQYFQKKLELCKKDWVTVHSIANFGLKIDGVEFALITIMLIVVMVGDKFVLYYCHKHAEDFLSESNKASHWSVLVDCEKDGVTQETIKSNMEKIGDGTSFKVEVHQVLIAPYLADYAKICSRYRYYSKFQRHVMQNSPEKKNFDVYQKMKEQEFSDLQQGTAKPLNRTKPSTVSIVTFKTKEMAHRVYQYWKPIQSADSKNPDLPQKHQSCAEFINYTKLIRCAEPDELKWEHLNHSQRGTGSFIIPFATTILMLGLAAFIGGFKVIEIVVSKKNPSQSTLFSYISTFLVFAASYGIEAVNGAIVKGLFQDYESKLHHHCFWLEVANYLITGLVVMNIPFLIAYHSADIWSPVGNMGDTWSQSYIGLLLSNIFLVFPLGYFFGLISGKSKRKDAKNGKLPDIEQKNFNTMLEGSCLETTKPDVDLATLSMTAFFGISFLPLTMVLVFVGTLINHYCCKINMTKFSKQPDTANYTFEDLRTGSPAGVAFATVAGYLFFYILALSRGIDGPAVGLGLMMIGIALLLWLVAVFEPFTQKLLQKHRLPHPWSKKDYANVPFADVEHLLEWNYACVPPTTRAAAYTRLDENIKSDPKLSPILKKALRTRLGVQYNVLVMQEEKVSCSELSWTGGSRARLEEEHFEKERQQRRVQHAVEVEEARARRAAQHAEEERQRAEYKAEREAKRAAAQKHLDSEQNDWIMGHETQQKRKPQDGSIQEADIEALEHRPRLAAVEPINPKSGNAHTKKK